MLPNPVNQVEDPKKRAMLLAALYIAQEQYEWITPDAVQRVAERLDLSPGQVYSTASFYTMFKLQPQGRYRVQVCEGLSCYLVEGAEPVIEYISELLSILPGETTSDGKFSLEIVQCLAACDFAPAIKINDKLYGDITFDKLDLIFSELSSKV